MGKPIYDPRSVSADVFHMDNMTEGANTKIMTMEERNKIIYLENELASLKDYVNNLTGMKYQIFTSSGTFTVPSGATQVLVTLIGGGGGGSKGGGGSLSGAGGGGGGVYYRVPVTVTPGSSIPVTIGSGGAGGTSSHIDGYAGETSSFGSYLSATGGGPGRGQGGSSTGGSTGSPSTPYYTQPGGKGMGYGWIDHIGGHGGGTILGGPAPGVCDGSSRGLVFGGGGSGGGWTANGGDGAPGVCIIEWEE